MVIPIKFEGMNVFVIPSWYPHESNPSYGIFIKEQVEMMAKLRQDWNFSVSTWGQGDYSKLLWVKDHVNNISKITKHLKDTHTAKTSKNITHFYQPCLSWSKRILNGNLHQIIKVNERNLLSSIAKFGRPDLILVQAGYPGIMIADHLKATYDIPVHLHLRLGGFMFERLLKDLGRLAKSFLSAIQRADIVSTTSQFQLRSLNQYLSKASIWHNPVDTDFFIPMGTQSEGIVAIGRLEKEKAFDRMIEAIKDMEETEVKLIGTGSEEDHLRKLVVQYSSHIHFEGMANRVQIRDYINNASFLVVPSHFETFGNVILESLACGKPVVATRCGGPEEILSEKTGILCDSSTEGLKEGIIEMMGIRDQFDPTSIRQEVVERFSPQVWVDRFEMIIKGII